MIEVVNRQRYRKVDVKPWAGFARKALDIIGKDKQSVTIAFVSNRRMRELNRRFRSQDKITDVLSFPDEPDNFTHPANANLGDIVISAEQAAKQATENGLTVENEIKQLILHGLLHLCGFDHDADDGEMNTRELELRDRLGI